jgi:hypothetical protein
VRLAHPGPRLTRLIARTHIKLQIAPGHIDAVRSCEEPRSVSNLERRVTCQTHEDFHR